MRSLLLAASACAALTAFASTASAQDQPPPPPSDPATTTSTTTADAPAPADAAPPSADEAPPPPAADAPPPPPPEPPLHDGGVRIGTLTCSAAGGWGLLIGSRRPISCTYLGHHGTEHYEGDLTKIGLDIGYKGRGAVVWTVIAPTAEVKPGDLKGHYGGITAGASAIVGVAANALVGGNRHQISLQPLSVEGNTGINASAGIGGMDLHFRGVTE